jgi:hypothetical protein
LAAIDVTAAPEPSEPLGSGPRVKTCSSSCSSWLHPLRSWSLRPTRGGSFRDIHILPGVLFSSRHQCPVVNSAIATLGSRPHERESLTCHFTWLRRMMERPAVKATLSVSAEAPTLEPDALGLNGPSPRRMARPPNRAKHSVRRNPARTAALGRAE